MGLRDVGPIEAVQAIGADDPSLEKSAIRLLIVNEEVVVVQVLADGVQQPLDLVVVVIAAELAMEVVIVAVDVAVIALLEQVVEALGQLLFIKLGLAEQVEDQHAIIAP